MYVHAPTAAGRGFLLALLSAVLLSGCGSGGGGNGATSRPGSLQFETSTLAAAEAVGGATVSVAITRTGGSDGAVSATVERQGTATAGADYTISATTVTFAAGDTTAKTLTVTIADDTAAEPDETLTLTLTAPTGGATIGSSPFSRITIADNDLPAAPALEPVSATMKQLQFSWQTVPGATGYRLLQSLPGGPFEPVGALLPSDAKSTTLEVSVHSLDWLKSRYRVDACIADRCSASEPVDVVDAMLAAIGVTTAPNQSGGNFGLAIALSGDGKTLAVAAPAENSSFLGVRDPAEPGNGLALGSGAVHVLTREQGAWVPQAFLKASNTDADDRFGTSVSLSDNGMRLAVGASQEDSKGAAGDDSLSAAGAVYVFERTGSQWSQPVYIKAVNPAPAALDAFGFSVALSGDGETLAVGAPGQETQIVGTGAVYVYTLNGGQWLQQDFLQAFNAGSNDAFGSAVSLSGDGNQLAVGAPREDSIVAPNDEAGVDIGAVYVFTRSGAVWSHDAEYLKRGDSNNGQLGSAVALSRDGATLVAGAFGTLVGPVDAAGAAYVFVAVAGQWSLQAELFAFNPDDQDRFGLSVAISRDGNVVAVGAPQEASSARGVGGAADNQAPNSGAVYVFRRTGTQWPGTSYVKSATAAQQHLFGRAAALDEKGSTLVAGAPTENDGTVHSY